MPILIEGGINIGGGVTVGAPSTPVWTWDPVYAGTGITLNNGNLVAVTDSSQPGFGSTVLGTWNIAASTKVMFSVCFLAVNGVQFSGIGVGSHDMDIDSYLGFDFATSQGVYDDGANYTQDLYLAPTGLPFNNFSTIDVAIDQVNNLFWFRVGAPGSMSDWNDGVDSANPATATGGYLISDLVGTIYPAATPYYLAGGGFPAGTVGVNYQSGGTTPAGFTYIAGTAPAWYWNLVGANLIRCFSNRTVADPNVSGTGTAIGNLAVGNTDKVMYTVRLTTGTDITLPLNQAVGFGQADAPLGVGLGLAGSLSQSMGVYNTGDVYFNGSAVYSGLPTFTQGDVIDIALMGTSFNPDWWYRVNGGDWNGSPAADPATDTGGLTQSVDDSISPLYPAVTVIGVLETSTFTIQDVPVYSVPSGFTFLGT